MIGRLHHVVLDCPDPHALAVFYSKLLGDPITYASADWVVVSTSSQASGLAFQLAPENRPPTWPDPAVPQQFHLDVMVEDVAAATPLVLALGARKLDGDDVFADPAGHPFCLITRPTWAEPIPLRGTGRSDRSSRSCNSDGHAGTRSSRALRAGMTRQEAQQPAVSDHQLGQELQSARLARRLGVGDATVIGLGSMIGAGVFSAFAPAARAAGTGLLIGLGIAAFVAFCNAVASAQLAAVYPTSGGTYIYGRERLGEWWGFAAGWAFVTGKTASCAAMALTFASYVAPHTWWARRLLAVSAVVALAALNYRGITRTARLTRILVGTVLACLAVTIISLLAAGHLETGNLALSQLTSAGWYGILQSSGLLFFAFAGYARIATLGEEVRDPRRTIPRAIPAALTITVALYALVAVVALLVAGPDRLAATAAPLTVAVDDAGVGRLAPVVQIGAALASLGALLALITGVGRTTLAMARHDDLPAGLAAVHPRHHVPHHAEIALAVVVSVLVLTTDLRGVIAFSSLGVLLYYGIANAAAYTQPPDQRRWPRTLQVLGVVGCLLLAATLRPRPCSPASPSWPPVSSREP